MERFRISALAASITAIVLAVPSAGVAHPRHKHRLRLPADYPAWSHVALCEEGGWYAPGGNYDDALGIDAVNWASAGGKPQYGHLSMVERIYEIRIADRFIRQYGIGIPDPGSRCAAW